MTRRRAPRRPPSPCLRIEQAAGFIGDERPWLPMLCWGAVKWVPETTGYDEAFDRSAAPRSHYRPLVSTLESFTLTEIARRERLQKISLVDQGITFTVYGEKDALERTFPLVFM